MKLHILMEPEGSQSEQPHHCTLFWTISHLHNLFSKIHFIFPFVLQSLYCCLFPQPIPVKTSHTLFPPIHYTSYPFHPFQLNYSKNTRHVWIFSFIISISLSVSLVSKHSSQTPTILFLSQYDSPLHPCDTKGKLFINNDLFSKMNRKLKISQPE